MENQNGQSKNIRKLMARLRGNPRQTEILAYSKKAEAEGKKNAAKLFKVASEAETIHALKHFDAAKMVHGTEENLKDAVSGETHEYEEMYPEFVKIAEAEGNKAAVLSFTFAMKAEAVHAKLYKDALEKIDETERSVLLPLPRLRKIRNIAPRQMQHLRSTRIGIH